MSVAREGAGRGGVAVGGAERQKHGRKRKKKILFFLMENCIYICVTVCACLGILKDVR